MIRSCGPSQKFRFLRSPATIAHASTKNVPKFPKELTLIQTSEGNGVATLSIAFAGVLAVTFLVAARQSALLLIDIADTLLHKNA